jgi:hypothetical protein
MSSVLKKLVDDEGNLKKDEVLSILLEYEQKLDGWKANLEVNSKRLNTAIVEHTTWAAYYDQVKIDLEVFIKFFDILLDAEAQDITIRYKEQSKYDYSETTLKRLINGNTNYVNIRKLKLGFEELHARSESISIQFYRRSFILKEYIRMIELAAQDITITL